MAIEELSKMHHLVEKYPNPQGLGEQNHPVTVCYLSQAAENDTQDRPLWGFRRDRAQVFTYIFLNQANRK